MFRPITETINIGFNSADHTVNRFVVYTDSNGCEKSRVFDSNGKFLSETSRDDIEFYEYNDYGLITKNTIQYSDGTTTDEEVFICDKDRYISSVDSDGYRATYEYDKKGNCIHVIIYDDEGNVYSERWYEYDKCAHCIHYKDSDDSEEWFDYDGDNLIYYKDSDGYKKWFKYDDNNKCIYTYANDGSEIEFEYDDKNRCTTIICLNTNYIGHFNYNDKIKIENEIETDKEEVDCTEEVEEMTIENGKQTTLHVVFVDCDREIIRELYVPCWLYRHTDMPYIVFNDPLIMDILTPITHEEGRLDFYDKVNDRFNFKSCPNVSDLAYEKCDIPDEIVVEILTHTIVDDKEDVNEYYDLLSPGLWQVNKNGERYRMCDDAILYILNKTYVPKIKKTCEDKHVDYTWKDLFFEAFRELHLVLMDPDDDEDDDVEIACSNNGNCDDCPHIECEYNDKYDDDDDEDDDCDEDDIDEFDCDDMCKECVNTDCPDNPNHSSKRTYDPDEYECMDDCKNCTHVKCVNNPNHEKDCVNLKEWYSDRCAGHCDECTRKVCITGDVLARNINKCDGCHHRKECETMRNNRDKKIQQAKQIECSTKHVEKKRKYRK